LKILCSCNYCVCRVIFVIVKETLLLLIHFFFTSMILHPINKWQEKLPKFLLQTISNRYCSFPPTISVGKILLDSLEIGNRNLSPHRLHCNYTVSCKSSEMPPLVWKLLIAINWIHHLCTSISTILKLKIK